MQKSKVVKLNKLQMIAKPARAMSNNIGGF
jgi:hypothetical protein